LAFLIALSGCTTGSVGYSIEIELITDPLISDPVFNVTRADLSNISWIIMDFEQLINNETQYITRRISYETHSVVLQTFDELGLIMSNCSQSFLGGSGAEVQGGWVKRCLYLDFEKKIYSIVLNTIYSA
jgi:hypothetical protein